VVQIRTAFEWKLVRDIVPAGSLFFTKGPGLISHMISCRSPVAHVGMILPYGDRIFGFDSTTQAGRAGVDLFNFSSLFYQKKVPAVYVMPLAHPAEKIAFIKDEVQEFCHTRYEKKAWRLASFYWGNVPLARDESLFCSELIVTLLAFTYRKFYAASAYHPKHIFYSCPPLGNLLGELYDRDAREDMIRALA
jgi:hypothetical protein